MEENPVIILFGSELNSMQSYRLSPLPHPRVQLLPWTCWTVGCNQHVGMVHQLYFFWPNALTEVEGCVPSKVVKKVTALSQNILQHEGKGCAAIDTLSNHKHHVLYFSHLCLKVSCSQVNGLFELFKTKYTSFHGNARMSRNCDCKCVIGGLILNSLSKVSWPSATITLSLLKRKYFVMCSKRTLVIKVLTYWMPKFFDQYSRERGTGHLDIFNKTEKYFQLFTCEHERYR